MNNYGNGRTDIDPRLQKAAAAAAQISAQLAAAGAQGSILAPSPAQRDVKKSIKTGRKDLFSSDIEINDLPPRVRNLLTKGYIQEQIQWKSKAALCTKGRYIAPQDKGKATDQPLFICVQAVDKNAVDEALRQIHQFIAEHTTGCSPPPLIQTAVPPPAVIQRHPPTPLVRDKVYISLEHAPVAFKVVERVAGSGGDNISYIQTETGASVSVQGQGHTPGSDEPLHLLLEHVDPDVVQSARSLALSLVGTLQQDFVQWQREQQHLLQQQQQQQQQFVYAFSQPLYNGTTTGNGSHYHYPAVAMVYGVEGGVPSRDLHQVQPPTSAPRETTVAKRSSRFDYQHPTGPRHSTGNDESSSGESIAKRTKAAHYSYR